jgi:hypothetical protein
MRRVAECPVPIVVAYLPPKILHKPLLELRVLA